jgi:multicomponent Na+:H+ antiporter subunit F
MICRRAASRSLSCAPAIRTVRGPAGADRVVALDLLGRCSASRPIGLAVLASGSVAFIDIALGALPSWASSTVVAFAGFIESVDPFAMSDEEDGR